MKQREPITHIMTKNVHTVNINETLKTVSDIFNSEKIHHLPVTNGKEIIGIISSTDFSRLNFGSLYDQSGSSQTAVLDSLTIEQVMTHHPTVVNSTDSIKEVAEVFAQANFHALPVVENENLVGIVTTTDMIKFLIAQY